MFICWKGWGWLVFFGTFAWLFAISGLIIGTDFFYEPDKAKAAALTERMFAIGFALSAMSVFLVARYRGSRFRKFVDPGSGQTFSIPNVDEFMFIRMKYWTPVLAVVAVGLLIRSFFE